MTATPLPPADAASEVLPAALSAVEATRPAAARAMAPVWRLVCAVALVTAAAALLASVLLWQRLASIQEHLARQSADSGSQAVEARAIARAAQDVARDAAARQAVMETRLSEVALQRSQLEELMQSLSRSRDENLVVDIESALRLAQQQAQLTGSAEPLLAALRSADQRLARAAQPRLARLRSAIGRDADRIKAAAVADVPGLLTRLDEVVRLLDELPLANAVPSAARAQPATATSAAAEPGWRARLNTAWAEARGLVRISRIDQPDAVLLAPEQAFFLRENLKLKLLNARLSLLARYVESTQAEVAAVQQALGKYFDTSARRTQLALTQLQQIRSQLAAIEAPRMDETLAALAAAAAGR